MTKPPENNQEIDRALSLRKALQSIENVLLKAGYDDFPVATEHGTFHWMTVERARERDRDA